MTQSPKAIFLSYAHEDAAVARRMAEALRGFGMEVWFDENELRGGDAWDAKLRQQIHACNLFLPIISAQTQERAEGYFRREWKLAINRMDDLAEGIAFLLPVVIDDTQEYGAGVPESFTHVQWIRLANGEPTPDFVAQVKRLLDAPRHPVPPATSIGRHVAGDPIPGTAGPVTKQRSGIPGWMIGAFAVVLLAAAVVYWTNRDVDPVETAAGAQPETIAEKQQTAEVAEKSIAVLAFDNMSDDPGNEYFSEGISEELLNVLAKIPGLKVTARTSSFFFKGRNVPVADIAQQLGVAYIVEGSVRKQGDKVRITAKLIKAADGFNVWSDRFDRDPKDIFVLQDEIAGLIAKQLQLELGFARTTRTVDPEAHRLLLEARFYSNIRGEENLDRAEGLLNRALEIDPDFAQAHATMASVWRSRAVTRELGGKNDVAEEVRQLRSSAERALKLDETLAEAYSTMAYALMREGLAKESEECFKKAVSLNPNDSTTRYYYGIHYMNLGYYDLALKEYERAREIDPMSVGVDNLRGMCAFALGRLEEALTLFRKVDPLRPGGYIPARAHAGVTLWKMGRREEAVEIARSFRRTWPEQPRAWSDASAIWILQQNGSTDEVSEYSRLLLKELPEESYQRGFVLTALDRFEEALPYLKKNPKINMGVLGWSPIFDSWREDPRFMKLIEELNWVEEYNRARKIIANEREKRFAEVTKP